MQNRKATYQLYPSSSQVLKLQDQLHTHQQLWNAALEERIDAWRKNKLSISYEDQCKSLTIIRKDNELKDQWASLNCSSQQITLYRLKKAFSSFFKRLKRGETPGFPRFKSQRRMTSLGFKSHGDGWKFKPNLKNNGKPDDFGNISWGRHGTLYLQGVGHMAVRGQARAAGIIKSCEVLHQNNKWFVSFTLECADIDVQRQRKRDDYIAADWGVTDLLTFATASHALTTPSLNDVVFTTTENPRWYKTTEDQSIALAQKVSRRKKFSKRWKKAQDEKSRFEAKRARKRHDHQHKLSAAIAATCIRFSTEKLDIKSMTAVKKDTHKENTFHREVLDTAPGALFQKIAYKVSETGGKYVTAPTKELKPSQTCICGQQKKKARSERWHRCGACGFEAGRDETAALIVLYWSFGILPPLKKETKNKNGQEPGESPNRRKTILSDSVLKPRNHHPSSSEFGGV